MVADTTEELERFRLEWQEEVIARSRGVASPNSSKSTRPTAPLNRNSGTIQPAHTAVLTFHKPYRETEEADELDDHGYHDLANKDEARKLGKAGDGIHPETREDPVSALEHYERAVERETEGNLGDSLNHYRKAYRVCHSILHPRVSH